MPTECLEKPSHSICRVTFLTLHTKIDEKLVSTEGGKSLSDFSFL